MSNQHPVRIETSDGTIEIYAIQPREWAGGGWQVQPGSEFDRYYFGDDTARVETGKELIPTLPVKITVRTGARWKYTGSGNKSIPVKIEFLHDGEPNTYTTGVAYFG